MSNNEKPIILVLTAPGGLEPVIVNVRAVHLVSPMDEGSSLYLEGGIVVQVDESTEAVLKALRELPA